MKYIPKRAPEGINAKTESPLKDAAFLLSLTAGLIAVIFIGLGFFTNLVVKKIDYGTETHLFQSMKTPVKTEKEKKIQKLVDRLWSLYPEAKGSHIDAGIIASKHLNAFMGIGGQMKITTALAEKAKYENELAFVICHEIGHFYNRDVLNGTGRSLGLAFILSYLGFGDSLDLVSLSTESLTLAFSRKQEQKADEFALDCMRRGYGHVQGHDSFFKWIIKEEATIPLAGRKAMSFVQSHPLTESRIEHLNQIIEKNDYPKAGKLTRLPYR